MEARDHHRGTLKVFRFLLITSSCIRLIFFFFLNSFSFVSSDFKTGDFIFMFSFAIQNFVLVQISTLRSSQMFQV